MKNLRIYNFFPCVFIIILCSVRLSCSNYIRYCGSNANKKIKNLEGKVLAIIGISIGAIVTLFSVFMMAIAILAYFGLFNA